MLFEKYHLRKEIFHTRSFFFFQVGQLLFVRYQSDTLYISARKIHRMLFCKNTDFRHYNKAGVAVLLWSLRLYLTSQDTLRWLGCTKVPLGVNEWMHHRVWTALHT